MSNFYDLSFVLGIDFDIKKEREFLFLRVYRLRGFVIWRMKERLE